MLEELEDIEIHPDDKRIADTITEILDKCVSLQKDIFRNFDRSTARKMYRDVNNSIRYIKSVQSDIMKVK